MLERCSSTYSVTGDRPSPESGGLKHHLLSPSCVTGVTALSLGVPHVAAVRWWLCWGFMGGFLPPMELDAGCGLRTTPPCVFPLHGGWVPTRGREKVSGRSPSPSGDLASEVTHVALPHYLREKRVPESTDIQGDGV